MRKFWIGIIAVLATIDVAGASYLWWLIDKRTAGIHAVTSDGRAKSTTRY